MTTMTTQPHPGEFARHEAPRGQLLRWTRGRFAKIAAWLATCADYHAAAGMYEELSRLSDAELKRRGLSRDTLARDVCESSEREAKS